MRLTTTKLVAAVERYVVPSGVAAAVALGAVLAFNSNGVHAASAVSTTGASPLDDHSVAALTSLDHAMESVASKVTPSVVNVAVTSTPSEEDGAQDEGQGQGGEQGLPPGFAQFFGPNGPFGGNGGGGRRQAPQQLQHGIGSGVIISPDGYIITNNHVVDGAKDIKVTLHDRRIMSAKLVGVDKLTDLAVIKVNATDLPAVAWGDSSKLEPGQTVLAFGSPFGYFQFSVTRGIVSAVDRANPFSTDARKPGGYIQTDAAINPGNSGGPLVDAYGQLIGINTWIVSDGGGSFSGAGFAIPSQMARAVSAQLIAHGHVDHGYMGISMNDVTPANARFFNLQNAAGAIVAQVTPNSPASRAGLHQGDVISGLNGHTVVNGSALQVAVSELQPGTKISLDVTRDGKPQTVDLTLGEYHAKGTDVASNGDAGPQSGKLGVAVADLNAETRQQLNLPDTVKGALVEQVRPASPAEDAGLQPGDVILEVNRKPTDSASQFASAVHGTQPGKDLLLLVWSKGNASYRTVNPGTSSKDNGE